LPVVLSCPKTYFPRRLLSCAAHVIQFINNIYLFVFNHKKSLKCDHTKTSIGYISSVIEYIYDYIRPQSSVIPIIYCHKDPLDTFDIHKHRKACVYYITTCLHLTPCPRIWKVRDRSQDTRVTIRVEPEQEDKQLVEAEPQETQRKHSRHRHSE